MELYLNGFLNNFWHDEQEYWIRKTNLKFIIIKKIWEV